MVMVNIDAYLRDKGGLGHSSDVTSTGVLTATYVVRLVRLKSIREMMVWESFVRPSDVEDDLFVKMVM